MDEPDELDEVIGEFLEESYENLDRLDQEFLALEEHPSSHETLSSIFRTIHTIKGTTGFLGFRNLGAVAHVGESLLSHLRDGVLTLTPEMTDVLLEMVDSIREMLAVVEATRTDGTETYDDLIARLGAFRPGAGDVSSPGEATDDTTVDATGEVAEDGSDDAVEDAAVDGEALEVLEGAAVVAGSAELAGTARSGETTIRVGVRLLDHLMNLVGELVLARNQVLQFSATQYDSTFLNTSQQLDLITTELQEGVMKTRMQPISGVWSKFPRMVRDLAHNCDKQVRVEMEGAETELDKTILEAIKDPLTHVLRNAVDHGIEPAAERVAAGKAAEGTIRLRAFHEGGQVVVEISDDGGGIDVGAIKDKAVERGLITAEHAASMNDQAAANLIFLPGFSTAAAITDVSGRGVGMDVVKTNIEKIGGIVDLQFVAGESTTLSARIPLTLAIIPALVVTCGQSRFLIPQVNLVELLRVEDDDMTRGIEYVGGAPVFRVRGRLLPIVHLSEVLGGCAATPDDTGTRNIVVLQADGRQFGLVVDDIHDTEEIVVKPLGPHLRHIDAFSGTTIMGDGAVALILDAIGIAAGANLFTDTRERDRPGDDDRDPDDRRTASTTVVIVCQVGPQRIAVPLALIERLEEFSVDDIEIAGGLEVVQYRDRLLTLLYLDRALDPDHSTRAALGEDDLLQVLVYSRAGRMYGLVVDQIVDIVDADLSARESSSNPNVEFSAVVGSRVSDVLKIDEIVAAQTDLTAPRLANA